MIDSETIVNYRNIANKIGLWDENYSTLKHDLQPAIEDIIDRDSNMDILGASLYQMTLMIRMLVYGNSEVELSDEDIDLLFEPIDKFEDLVFSPNLFANGANAAVEGMLPLVFDVAEKSDDYAEFEKVMRMMMAEPSDLTATVLSYGLAVGTCLRTYDGMSKYIEPLTDYIKTLLESSEKATAVARAIENHFKGGNTLQKRTYLFSALFATAATDCNCVNEISYMDLVSMMDKIRETAKNNKDMYDFLTSGNNFRFYMHCLEEYHGDKD